MDNVWKVYVDVEASFDRNGMVVPHSLTWEDGRVYPIDRVTEIRQAAAQKAGGQGDRYTIWVMGQRSYLFFERSPEKTGRFLGRWFVERKTPGPVAADSEPGWMCRQQQKQEKGRTAEPGRNRTQP